VSVQNVTKEMSYSHFFLLLASVTISVQYAFIYLFSLTKSLDTLLPGSFLEKQQPWF